MKKKRFIYSPDLHLRSIFLHSFEFAEAIEIYNRINSYILYLNKKQKNTKYFFEQRDAFRVQAEQAAMILMDMQTFFRSVGFYSSK
jgi:hypothetical protein